MHRRVARYNFNMKIAFLGSGAFGLPSLQQLLADGCEIVCIITQPDRPAGRGGHLTPTPVAAFAAAAGLPTIKPADVNTPEIVAAVAGCGAELMVVIAFGQKLSDQLLACAPRGAINLHASLLPAFRGAAPINWAILSGCRQTGVSVIEVNAVMDGGNILAAAATPIGDQESAGELHDRLAQLGAPVLARVVGAMARGEAVPAVVQDASQKSQAPKLLRSMAWVKFTDAAEVVSCRIRGLSPWPGCALVLHDAAGKPRVNVHILKCKGHPGDGKPTGTPGIVLADLTVACGAGRLEIIELQPEGRKKMTLADFANGYGLKPGCRWQSLLPPP